MTEQDQAGIGHNSGEVKDVEGLGGQRLKAFLDRLDRMEEETEAIRLDVKEIYAEAKAVGFCTKTMRKIQKIKKMDVEKRREEEELLELYKSALGMV